MNKTTFILQEGKDVAKIKTAYIFKGLGYNLIPSTPNEKDLNKMKAYLKNQLSNNGENSDEAIVNNIIGSSPQIGLTLSFRERKFIETLTMVIANSTLMDLIQKNTYYHKKGKDYKNTPINYKELRFKIPIKSINKLFGRSVLEKEGENKENLIERLSKKKFFLKTTKGQIVYQKAFPMICKDDYLIFTFHHFLVGKSYDKRKDFFKDINTLYETIFFELLFRNTKEFRKTPNSHFCFTARSLLKDLGLDKTVKTHKNRVRNIINICFKKAFDKGVFTELYQYEKEIFNKDDKQHINIAFNPDYKWCD